MITKIEKYCTELLLTSKCKELPFHNLQHTQEVVQNVKHITAAMNVDAKDTELLVGAAWFHDTGFSKIYQNHEDESKRIAEKFLSELGVDTVSIKKICNYIEATKMPQSPTSELAEILCDADIFHISNLHFYYRKLLLRREWEVFCDMRVSDKEWHELNLNFLEDFHFRSTYGKNFLEIGKQENVERVKNILLYYKD
jgi:uncharacterized protein